MLNRYPEPIDYLIIGHIACDRNASGIRLGGTAVYAALTARALGLRVGIVTATGFDVDLSPLGTIPIAGIFGENCTIFENIHTNSHRTQIIHQIGPELGPYMVPDSWRKTPMVHFGPIADEIDLDLLRIFPESEIFLTPQGWLRSWDKDGKVGPTEWPEASYVLPQAAAVVLSMEDVGFDEQQVEEFAAYSDLIVITEGEGGARIFDRGESSRIPALPVQLIDDVGAGDIFATAFFIRYMRSLDSLTAARFATALAGFSVQREGLAGIPTMDEIDSAIPRVG